MIVNVISFINPSPFLCSRLSKNLANSFVNGPE